MECVPSARRELELLRHVERPRGPDFQRLATPRPIAFDFARLQRAWPIDTQFRDNVIPFATPPRPISLPPSCRPACFDGLQQSIGTDSAPSVFGTEVEKCAKSSGRRRAGPDRITLSRSPLAQSDSIPIASRRKYHRHSPAALSNAPVEIFDSSFFLRLEQKFDLGVPTVRQARSG